MLKNNRIQVVLESDQFNPNFQGVRFFEGDYDFGIWDIEHTSLRGRAPDSLDEDEIRFELVSLILQESEGVMPYGSLFELGLHKALSAP